MAKDPPMKFGRCRLVRRLGYGATAVVFLARHEALDMDVAVKILRRKLADKRPEYAERFLREARMAARLDHPNIVRVFDCGIEDGYHYMVMDYVDGPNCQEKLEARQKPFEWREAARVVRQAAAGLAYAAQSNVIHRDVKPSNILIDTSGRARISDLGLAKLTIRGMASLTQELYTVGTPNYMSPEQISSPTDLGPRSDIYSLGATFYHLVTGKPPFVGDNAMRVVAQHLTAPLLPPIEHDHDLPEALNGIVCKMMAKSPEERYQTYEELCRDLDNLLAGRQVDAAGFSETQRILTDGELQEVLAELDFGEELEIAIEELEEESAADTTLEDVENKAAAHGTSTVFTFSAEDLAATSPSASASSEELRIRRRQSEMPRIVIILGILALLILAVLLGYFLAPPTVPTRP